VLFKVIKDDNRVRKAQRGLVLRYTTPRQIYTGILSELQMKLDIPQAFALIYSAFALIYSSKSQQTNQQTAVFSLAFPFQKVRLKSTVR
jgi:hypothetical protein